MSKTCKKLLASVLAVTMLFSTMISALVVSAEAVNKGTFTVGTTEIEVGDTTAELDLTIAFRDGEDNPIAIKSPHDMFTLTAPEGFTLENVVVKSQVITNSIEAIGEEEGVQGEVNIKYTEGGTNFAAGKVIIESPVDEQAPEITDIVLTATYAVADTVVAGEYEIAVASSLADWYEGVEGDIALTDVAGAIVVADAHEHSFTGTETTAPTCTEPGVMTYNCECGKDSYTEEIPALGHTEAEAVIENEVAADCDTAGSYDTVVYCSVCDAEISRETIDLPLADHNYVDGTCDVCGADDPDYEAPTCDHDWVVSNATAAVYNSTLGVLDMTCSLCGAEVAADDVEYQATYSFFYNSASFEEQILVNFKGVTSWLSADCEDFLVVFEKAVYGKDSVYTTADFDDGVSSTNISIGGTYYPSTSWSLPIAAKEMNDEISATVFMLIDDVWYSGQVSTTSFVGYATQLLTSTYDSSADLQKFVVNAMYYGGKAQINFNYDVENPAYAHIPAAYEKYITTTTPTCEGAVEGGSYTAGDKVLLRGSSMSAESKTEMNHKFLLMDKEADISKVTIKASFTKDDGSTSDTILVYDGVATQDQIANSEIFAYTEQDSGFAKYTLAFAGLAAKEMRKVVTFTTLYDGEPCMATYSCSLENLAAMTISAYSNDTALVEMLYAMLNYGDAASEYFSK